MIKNVIIKSFNVKIDYNKIGLPTEVFIFVSFLPNADISQRELAKRISKFETAGSGLTVPATCATEPTRNQHPTETSMEAGVSRGPTPQEPPSNLW